MRLAKKGGRGDRSADVSHAAGPLRTRTEYDGLMGVTTSPQGKQRDEYEGQSKDKNDLFAEERFIRLELKILDQMDFHAAAAHAESIGEANAEARAEADRARAEADRGRAEAHRVIMASRV